MPTQCTPDPLSLEPHSQRRVELTFDGGFVSSDSGALLLREVEAKTRVLKRLSDCFTDSRDQRRVEFSVQDLLTQRVFGLILGYEDLDDHDRLRHDPLLALGVGRDDVLGHDRGNLARDGGKALAGKSTLNRIERAADSKSANPRYHKVVVDKRACDELMMDVFLEQHRVAPTELVIDLDPSDVQLHGDQEGRFFHGYYGHHCYLPLYLFIGPWPVGVRLRRSNIDGADGCIEELDRVVERLRKHWPDVSIIVRGDSGFARDEILSWFEDNHIDYVIGLARNKRLERETADEMAEMVKKVEAEKKAFRSFKELRYQTEKTWSRERRVVAKVEALPGKTNPRFVVTSLTEKRAKAQALYEDMYCARGEMENHIKEQQLDLFGTRASTSTMSANELRLYFSAFAHLFVVLLRHLGLAGTKMASATAGTIRARLLKVGAIVRVSVRRIHIALSHAFPQAQLFRDALANLQASPA